MTSLGLAIGGTIAGLAVLLAGCAPPTAERVIPEVQPTELKCQSEAEQLLEPARVFAGPAPAAALLDELEAGRFVYRCERRGAWMAIMYPAPDEPVDCSSRAAGRCRIGWVRGELPTAIFG